MYRFETTTAPVQPMRLKIEINTREHFAALDPRSMPFCVESPWFSGTAQISTFADEELLGTKLRALYQRKKGRDLYDLGTALSSLAIDDGQVVACFGRYMKHGGRTVSRAEFQANLRAKLHDPGFLGDVGPLLASASAYDPISAADVVVERLISRLPGRSRRSSRGGDSSWR